MIKFENLFGMPGSDVKKTCVLMPFLTKDSLNYFGIEEFSRGKIYGSGNSENFTLIRAGLGPSLSGDAVLYLKDTPCENLILFGSCGSVNEENDLTIGSMASPESSYSLESFSDVLLRNKKNWKSFSADQELLERFLCSGQTRNVKKVKCATMGSLKLEEEYLDLFKQKSVQTVDMECSAFFSASLHARKKAIALFYVSDIINKKPFYADLGKEDKTNLSSAVKSAADILCEFIKKNLTV
jgi:purine-nucleoside phosphorylase